MTAGGLSILSLCSIGLKATSVTSAEGGLTWVFVRWGEIRGQREEEEEEDWIGISFLP